MCAGEGARTSTTETLGITSENGRIALQTIVAVRPLKEIWTDKQLSWGEVSQARHTLLRIMEKAGEAIWDQELLDSFTDFFTGLDENQIREELYGDEAIVEYQAWARREWHNMQLSGEGMNLVIINNTLLKNIQQEIMIEKGAESIHEVSGLHN
ncbi:hypothetical protein BDQ17DRAFT_1232438 [Cyathus striatus]|nr:hypothetical protein BDQ17DRAFT_1232438 [Cyathus striatus]